MTNIKLTPVDLVRTPEDWAELNAWIDRHSGSERAHITVAVCMAWNLASKLLEEAKAKEAAAENTDGEEEE